MKRAHVEQASLAWVLFWGVVAVDSALTHKRSVEAVKKAEDSDPYVEAFDGPVAQDWQVSRGILFQPPTLSRLRQLCRRAEWWKSAAPWIALFGPPVIFALGRRSGDARRA